MELLNDADLDSRLASLRALQVMARHSEPVQRALVRCLGDSDHRIRLAAATALSVSDMVSDAVVAGLIVAFKDQHPAVRAAAAARLVCTNSKGGVCLAEGMLNQAEADSAVLARSPHAAAALRAGLADPDPRVRAGAAYLLPVFQGDAAASVSLLSERLSDAKVVVRIAAAKSLGQFGKAARPALPALFQALTDPGGVQINGFSVSTNAAQAVLSITPDDDANVFDRLVAALSDSRENVRGAATETLQTLKQTASSRLYRALADSTVSLPVKRRIVQILATQEMGGGMQGESGPDEKTTAKLQRVRHAAIPALSELTDDPDEAVCFSAINLLAEVDSQDHPLAQLILDAVARSAVSLEQIDSYLHNAPPTDAPVFTKGLKHPNENVRTVAAYTLADIAFDEPRVVQKELTDVQPELEMAEHDKTEQDLKSRIIDALIALLHDPDTQVRWAAAWGLGTFAEADEHPPSRALPPLLAMLRDKSTVIREGAWIRVANGDIDQGLNSYTSRNATTENLRIAAIQAICGFGKNAASSVPDLVDALKDGDFDVRWYAAMALGKIGPPAQAAVPFLVTLLQSPARHDGSADSALLPDGSQTRMTFPFMAAERTRQDRPRSLRSDSFAHQEAGRPGPDLADRGSLGPGAIGPKDPAVLQALAQAMTSTIDGNLGEQAAQTLGSIGEAALPALVSALHSRDGDIRERASRALGQMTASAEAALPDLERAAAVEEDPVARTSIEAAIRQIRDGGQEPRIGDVPVLSIGD